MNAAELKSKQRDTSGAWVSPHFGDGGWHNTPGTEADGYGLTLDPLFDHILVEFIPPEQGIIIHPDIAIIDNHSREARVLKVGSGERKIEIKATGEVRIKAVRFVKPGDLVIVGPHSDWESQDGKYGIFEEDDVRGILTQC